MNPPTEDQELFYPTKRMARSLTHLSSQLGDLVQATGADLDENHRLRWTIEGVRAAEKLTEEIRPHLVVIDKRFEGLGRLLQYGLERPGSFETEARLLIREIDSAITDLQHSLAMAEFHALADYMESTDKYFTAQMYPLRKRLDHVSSVLACAALPQIEPEAVLLG